MSYREHDTNGRSCWCGPRIFLPCNECEDHRPGCWKCEDGLIELTPEEANATEAKLIVVHFDPEDT